MNVLKKVTVYRACQLRMGCESTIATYYDRNIADSVVALLSSHHDESFDSLDSSSVSYHIKESYEIISNSHRLFDKFEGDKI
jgi:hypothetical protein